MKLDPAVEHEIKMIGNELAIGARTRTTCPFCGDEARDFSVQREPTGLLYHCFRAGCDEGGFLPTSPYGSACLPAIPYCQRTANPYKGELHTLQERDKAYFQARFGLDVPDYTIMRSSLNDEQAQYVMALKDYRGYTRGHAVRRGGWKGEPKTPGRVENTIPKTRTFLDGPTSIAQHVERGHFTNEHLHTVVVVEDYVSALKVASLGPTGVALMGVVMNSDRAREIQLLKPTQVVIALDADATEKALEIARVWGLSWAKVRVAMLERDLKDTANDDILDVLSLV